MDTKLVNSDIRKDVLCHYTDISALASMCVEDGLIFRMTNSRFLNDKDEYIAGYEIIEKSFPDELKNLRDKKGESRNHYVISLSNAYNSLPMWNTYGRNGNGIAIEFDKVKLFEWLEEKGYPYGFCKYDEEQFKKQFKDEVTPEYLKDKNKKRKNHISEYADISWSSFKCLLYKNPAFEYEQELRFSKFVYPYESEHKNTSKIKFRERNNKLIPYIEEKIPYNLVSRIILGPSNGNDLNMISLEILRKRFKIICDIEQSKLPFRD